MSREKLFTITKDDLICQTFRCGGNGGQNQNKLETGVRFIHKPSGATGESREERKQIQNKGIAFKRLVNSTTFRNWVNLKAREIIDGKTVEEKVAEDMKPENIKVEVLDKDKWVNYEE